MRRVNLYPMPAAPLVNDGSKGDTSKGKYDALVALPAGEYVFMANVTSESAISPKAFIFSSSWKPLCYINDAGQVQASFTLDEAQTIRIRPAQTGVTLSGISVESKRMHDFAVGGGFRAASPRKPLHTKREAGHDGMPATVEVGWPK